MGYDEESLKIWDELGKPSDDEYYANRAIDKYEELVKEWGSEKYLVASYCEDARFLDFFREWLTDEFILEMKRDE